MNREELYAIVAGKVDEMFLAYQTENHIENGDIDPLEALKLDDLQNQLTDLIISVNQHNMPEPATTETSEIDERLARITSHAQHVRNEEKRKKEEEEKAKMELLQKVIVLTPRIQTLIKLANKCIEEKIPIPTDSKTKQYGYEYDFFAEGIYHHLGFMGRSQSREIKYIGIYAGGFCGVWDFYTNGCMTFEQHERDSERKQNASIYHMDKFLKEFDLFETAFLKWIDSLA